MIGKFQRYIEQEPWEEKIAAWERIADVAGWAVIIIAVLYFGPVILRVLLS